MGLEGLDTLTVNDYHYYCKQPLSTKYICQIKNNVLTKKNQYFCLKRSAWEEIQNITIYFLIRRINLKL